MGGFSLNSNVGDLFIQHRQAVFRFGLFVEDLSDRHYVFLNRAQIVLGVKAEVNGWRDAVKRFKRLALAAADDDKVGLQRSQRLKVRLLHAAGVHYVRFGVFHQIAGQVFLR